ncbi:MAG: hypothetical protein R2733_02620 [Acidimicrobiales bacterium]
MAMTLRLTDEEQAALRQRAELEGHLPPRSGPSSRPRVRRPQRSP